ncbi:hypothetical protein [Pseudomonas protegens]|jgi:hypothetical protein|uniref:hypothetical protein n=1 Tax=Pseudomonas protegens TaxID=380021 RepID=UPI0006418CC6|nr:hypothetical protein [Pseudomonas protegens]
MSMDSADSNTSQFIKQHAESQYEQFHQKRQREVATSADKRLADLSQLAHQLSDKTRKND